ncbi:SDR family NAD(P)-dependent oxidoreductase [Micromonospora sp. DT233]|uniref:SDR family NAD(P)-dependent oxidoreductase n=1 Tax=Micromonospora sp. DT233 TaxID=3393432 RepID=UPI003CF8ABED
MTKRWMITGCSSGLGRALAARLAAKGEQVVATARRPETLDGLVAQHPGNVVAVALERPGSGAVHGGGRAGGGRLRRAVLPAWRAQRRGHAVFVSSVAGTVPFPGLAAYTASKFAV